MKAIIYTHTHWDREWYQPFQEYRLRLAEVMEKILSELKSGKLDQFYVDGQTIAMNDYLEIFPEKKDEILNLINEKKLMLGPWYVLADEFLVSGESLIRNLLTGINQSKKYGCDKFIGYLPDAFGHAAYLPAIFKSFNIDKTVLWRGAGKNKSEFIWKSPDGSSVTAIYLIEGYFQDILSADLTIAEKAKKIEELLDKIAEYNVTDTILLPSGADHLAPADDTIRQIINIDELISNYSIESGLIFDYTDMIDKSNLDLKTVKGELRDNSRNFILPGTYSSRLYLKKANAISTWKLSKLAEPLQAWCEFTGISPSRKNQLEYNWELLLKNHPHDSICGCSVDAVHNEMMTRFASVDQISDGIITRCMNELAEKVKKGSLLVYNSSDYPYSGVIKVKTRYKIPKNLSSQHIQTYEEFPPELLCDIGKIPVKEDITEFREILTWVDEIPPHGFKVIDENDYPPQITEPVEIGDDFIRNSKIVVNINTDGSFDIYGLETGEKFENLHRLEDIADVGDTYNFAPIKGDLPIKPAHVFSEIVEKGDFRSVLRINCVMEIPDFYDKKEEKRSSSTAEHIIATDIILHAGSSMVEFETFWKNKSCDHLLKLKFNTGKKVFKTVSEDNFGIITRDFDPDYDLTKFMPAPKKVELKTNTAPMQRFVHSNGLGIITEGLTEYGVEGNDLYITLLRSTGILSAKELSTRETAAGPPLKTPTAQCLGIQKARYAVYLTQNPIELFKYSDLFMGSILSTEGKSEENRSKSSLPDMFFTIGNENTYTYAVKPLLNGKKGIIARVMNLSDKHPVTFIKTLPEAKTYQEVNSLEEPLSEAFSINTEIKFSPFEIKSLMIN